MQAKNLMKENGCICEFFKVYLYCKTVKILNVKNEINVLNYVSLV